MAVLAIQCTAKLLRDVAGEQEWGTGDGLFSFFELRDDGIFLATLPPTVRGEEIRAVTGGLANGNTALPLLQLPCSPDQLAAFDAATGMFSEGLCDVDPGSDAMKSIADRGGTDAELVARYLIQSRCAPGTGGQSAVVAPRELLVNRTNSTKGKRGGALSPLIDEAVRRFGLDDTAKGWVWLESEARRSDRPAPLAGVTSGGVQYHDGGQVKTFTRKSYGARLNRLREKSRPIKAR